jgi:hypothetical protein
VGVSPIVMRNLSMTPIFPMAPMIIKQQPGQPPFHSLHPTIRFSPNDVVHDVPGVNTRRDEFRAFFGQFGKDLLPDPVDDGNAYKVHHALAFPASGRRSRPVGLQFRNPRVNELTFQSPSLFGGCLDNRDSQHSNDSLPSLSDACPSTTNRLPSHFQALPQPWTFPNGT